MIRFRYLLAIGLMGLGMGRIVNSKEIAVYPFYVVSDSNKSAEKNEVQLLNSGLAALQKRIDLIRKAKHSIVLEYFIYESDTTGKIIYSELMKRAKEGIDVRILLDKSITVFEQDEYYAQYLLENSGVKLAYYNRGMDPSTAQFRTHRKILSIDGKEAITGGRNIGDDYFDLDEEYTFLDRDIYIKGPIAKAIYDSFEAFWNYEDKVKPVRMPKVRNYKNIFKNSKFRSNYTRKQLLVHRRRLKEVREWFADMEGISETKEKIEEIARPILDATPLVTCPKLTFTSDLPGGSFLKRIKKEYKNEMRVTRKEVLRRLNDPKETGSEVYLASPYFILNRDWESTLNKLISEGKTIKLFTNSLRATDAFYVAALFYDIVFDWEKKGLIPYVHSAKFAGITDVVHESVKNIRWGTHSKTHIYDEDSLMIGTYNIDNRSDFYNAEMAVFCDGSKELVNQLKENVNKRLKIANRINGYMTAVDSDGNEADVYAGASEKELKNMKRMLIPGKIFKPLM